MIKTVEMYAIVCDYPDCDFETSDLGGDFSAWSDIGAAHDEWINSDCISVEINGEDLYFCAEHRMDLCTICDSPDAWEHSDGDIYCDECWQEIEEEENEKIVRI